MPSFDTDDNGFPIMLATRAPGQVAAQPDPSGAVVMRGASRGNPNFDPRTGRFAGPGGSNGGGTGDPSLPEASNRYITLIRQQFPDATSWAAYVTGDTAQIVFFDQNGNRLTTFDVPSQNADEAAVQDFADRVLGPAVGEQQAERAGSLTRSGVPQGVDQETWERRLDAVRDAAREMDDMSEGDARDFLAGRAADVSQVDVQQFLRDVREQRLDDLADILDQQLRGTVERMSRSRRTVRLVAPRGWTKRVFGGLDDEEVVKLLVRMEGKGWDPEDLTDNIIKKVSNEERRTKLEQLYGERKKKSGKKTQLAWDPSFDFGEHFEVVSSEEEHKHEKAQVNLADELAKIAERMPSPHITVNIPPPVPMKRTPVRDEKNRIVNVIEEPIVDG